MQARAHRRTGLWTGVYSRHSFPAATSLAALTDPLPTPHSWPLPPWALQALAQGGGGGRGHGHRGAGTSRFYSTCYCIYTLGT